MFISNSGSFYPPRIRIREKIPDPDPDPWSENIPDPHGSGSGSGSETLQLKEKKIATNYVHNKEVPICKKWNQLIKTSEKINVSTNNQNDIY